MGYLNKRKDSEYVYVDTDMIAFHVEPKEVEHIVDFLVAALFTQTLMEHGESPVEF